MQDENITCQELPLVNARQGSIYLIGNLHRLGVLQFATQTEYKLYPPNTELNDNYHIFYVVYSNIPHCIVEVPGSDFKEITAIAGECNLSMVNGKPYGTGENEFKLKCSSEACFTLETKVAKKLSAGAYETSRANERTKVENLITEYEQNNPVKKELYHH